MSIDMHSDTALITANVLFHELRTLIDKTYPEASPDARLAAVVELCKTVLSYSDAIVSA